MERSLITSRRNTERRTTSNTSPRHPNFSADVLAPLARRWAAGERADVLSRELFTVLYPWAQGFAASQSAGLPAHADRSEVLSQVLRLTWDACARIDWKRYEAWPAFLETKVRRARAEAARVDDWLSRRERIQRRRFQLEVDRLEQQHGRRLNAQERDQLARSVVPSTARVDWADAVLAARHPSTVSDVPDVVGSPTVADEVEAFLVGDIRKRCLTDWLAMVAADNSELAEDLERWSQRHPGLDGDLPARLAHRVEPYRPLLLSMLGEAA